MSSTIATSQTAAHRQITPHKYYTNSESWGCTMQQSTIIHRTYNLTPLPLFGVEVNGIDLGREVEPETVAAIKNDVAEYRLMVFRGQGVVSAHRQVEISHWFGELDCPFYKHPASAHPEVCMLTVTDTVQ